MGKVDFDEFIKKQNTFDDEDIGVDWDKEKRDWLSFLDQFYNKIEILVKEYKDKGDISLEYQKKVINEKNIGEYSVKKIKMKIKDNEVIFDPIGTNLIGAKGRVDMKSCAGTARFVLVNKELSAPKTKINIQTITEGETTFEKPESNGIEWDWKIATAPPFLQYLEINEDTFFDALMEIINE